MENSTADQQKKDDISQEGMCGTIRSLDPAGQNGTAICRNQMKNVEYIPRIPNPHKNKNMDKLNLFTTLSTGC
ncbi:hypothetical protein ABEW32_03270 [Paenibacillus jamilae]|uniref:hypothetical protein n=1 Tax=Paenibacillus jamilae TaxID=114136 RepID=UPI003D27B452